MKISISLNRMTTRSSTRTPAAASASAVSPPLSNTTQDTYDDIRRVKSFQKSISFLLNDETDGDNNNNGNSHSAAHDDQTVPG
jgi:hypothetical protein